VKLNDPPKVRNENIKGFIALDEILETSEIITIHVPLIRHGGDKTFHLFDSGNIEKMKKGAWLINSSRGEVIETNALKKALSSGKLGGAVLDVWENEPYIDLELLKQVFISTPHIAGYSSDGKANGTSQVVQSLSNYFGLPLHDFYPPNLPAPAQADIVIEGAGKSNIEVVYEAVLHTYPIMDDHNRLQYSPETFELQRSQYPIRREFKEYTVRLLNGKPEAVEVLRNFGFTVK